MRKDGRRKLRWIDDIQDDLRKTGTKGRKNEGYKTQRREGFHKKLYEQTNQIMPDIADVQFAHLWTGKIGVYFKKY